MNDKNRANGNDSMNFVMNVLELCGKLVTPCGQKNKDVGQTETDRGFAEHPQRRP